MTQDAYLFEIYLHLSRVNKGSKDMHYNNKDALFRGGILRGGKWVKRVPQIRQDVSVLSTLLPNSLL